MVRGAANSAALNHTTSSQVWPRKEGSYDTRIEKASPERRTRTGALRTLLGVQLEHRHDGDCGRHGLRILRRGAQGRFPVKKELTLGRAVYEAVRNALIVDGVVLVGIAVFAALYDAGWF